MSEPVTVIRNVGPAMAKAFADAGITTAEDLRELGADAAYGRLIATGTRPHFIGYYALVMGLQGRPWNDCQGAEKRALREKFDSLRLETTPDRDALPGNLASALDRIGVRSIK